MNWLRSVFIVLCFTVGMFAQGGLNVALAPPVVSAGEPCDWITVTLSNLVPGTSYSATLELAGPTGVPIPGYLSEIPPVKASSTGTITIRYCIEVAVGNYMVNATVSTSGQTLSGSALLSSQ